MSWQMTIADYLPPHPNKLWDLGKQVGVTAAVTGIPDPIGTPFWIHTPPVWEYSHLAQIKERFADADLDLQVIESAPHSITEPIRLGLPDREEKLDRFCELLVNMGKLEIPIICPHWMPVLGPMRTTSYLRERGGAMVTGYTHSALKNAPMTEYGEISEEQLWENASIFLERVVPVAESANVKIAVHPDDPPVSPIRGIGRILTSPDAFQRWLDIVPSPSNGVTFCQGSFASMDIDIPATIRRFGNQGKIHFVHFRDIKGKPEEFVETFQDNGDTDMAEAVRAYREVGFTGPMRIDHVPTMAGEEQEDLPGYETLGRLFAIGYVKGLMEAVDKYT
jgi:mannonate dehydratase